MRHLCEVDADFRRSIVSSKETLATIVDASITELRRLRASTGEERLKIIASALNMEHCKQIVAAYRERGLRADYIHSREDSRANDGVLAKLDRHELDVIVQVRMLGEGFDHPGLVQVPLWRPEGKPPRPRELARAWIYGGVGRRTER